MIFSHTRFDRVSQFWCEPCTAATFTYMNSAGAWGGLAFEGYRAAA